MSYIHESALKKAVKMLHMLGSSDRHKIKPDMSEFEGGMSAMVGAGMNQQALQKKQKADWLAAQKADAAQFDSDVEYIRGNSELSPVKSDRYQVSMGRELPMKYDASITAKEAAERIKTNDMAENTRMGGRYTPGGLEMTEVNATKDAEDRMRAKAMIGQQMQMQPPGMIGIGGTRRGY